jgi:hypothetical protein
MAAPEIRATGGLSVPTVTERRGFGNFRFGSTRIGWRRALGSVAPPEIRSELTADVDTGLGGEPEIDEDLVIGG